MRLIDADSLIERMKNTWDMQDLYLPVHFEDFVEDEPTIGGWISADKRPPKQGRYLVWGLTQIIPNHNDEPNGYWQTKIAQWFEGIGWDCKVKFWQMLPEPPKEDYNG